MDKVQGDEESAICNAVFENNEALLKDIISGTWKPPPKPIQAPPPAPVPQRQEQAASESAKPIIA